MALGKNAKLEAIKAVPLFSGCNRKELSAIASVADEIDLPAGRTLTREGERGREFVVILEGSADVRKSGRKVNTLGPGDFLGEIALIANLPRTATVTTTAPVRALVVTQKGFRSVLARLPEIHMKLVQALAQRLAATSL
jgi:CRP-like cAMP-binding protein